MLYSPPGAYRSTLHPSQNCPLAPRTFQFRVKAGLRSIAGAHRRNLSNRPAMRLLYVSCFNATWFRFLGLGGRLLPLLICRLLSHRILGISGPLLTERAAVHKASQPADTAAISPGLQANTRQPRQRLKNRSCHRFRQCPLRARFPASKRLIGQNP